MIWSLINSCPRSQIWVSFSRLILDGSFGARRGECFQCQESDTKWYKRSARRLVRHIFDLHIFDLHSSRRHFNSFWSPTIPHCIRAFIYLFKNFFTVSVHEMIFLERTLAALLSHRRTKVRKAPGSGITRNNSTFLWRLRVLWNGASC